MFLWWRKSPKWPWNFVARGANRDKTLLIFDESGRSLPRLQRALEENGYRDFYFLAGGIEPTLRQLGQHLGQAVGPEALGIAGEKNPPPGAGDPQAFPQELHRRQLAGTDEILHRHHGIEALCGKPQRGSVHHGQRQIRVRPTGPHDAGRRVIHPPAPASLPRQGC